MASNVSSQYSRRDFIKSAALLTAATTIVPTALSGCKKKSNFTAKTDPFEIMRDLQVAVRSSKDHLRTRQQACIDSKDQATIFAFVRDEIQTLPNPMSWLSVPGQEKTTEQRWGATACLRYAGGTFLEKALLLISLLEQAGFKANLVHGDFDISAVGYARVFFREFDTTFAIDESQKDALVNVPERFKNTPNVLSSSDESYQSALKQVLAAIPSDFTYPSYDWQKLCQKMYEVEITHEGKTIRLNPSIADAKLGDTFIGGKSVKSTRPTFSEKIKVSLSISNARNPQKPVEFTKGEIPLEKLFGNQLIVSFQSNLDSMVQLSTPRYAITTLTPIIAVAGDLTDEEKRKFTFFGKSIHLDGRTLEVKQDQLFVDGIAMPPSREHPELRSRSARMELTTSTTRFPTVDVYADVLDTSGNRIEGMEGADFFLSEDGQSIPFRLRRNQQIPVKILLVIDYSGSMPAEFRSGGDKVFARDVLEKIATIQANATFRVANFKGDQLLYTADWNGSIDEVIGSMDQMVEKNMAGSQLWSVLARATKSDASMVMFLTDGGAVDNPSMEEKISLSAGCPAMILGIGDQVKTVVTQSMADYSGGIYRPFEEKSIVLDFMIDYIKQHGTKSYHFDYLAQATAANQRKVTLELKETSIENSTEYLAPALKERLSPGWTGIYLTLQYRNKTVTRKLAGMPINNQVEAINPVLSSYQRETNAAFFGDYRICIEGAEPNTADLLDELIAARLDQETYWRAYRAKKTDEAMLALDQGFHSYPDRYFHMQQRFAKNSGDDFISYQDGIKAILFSTIPGANGQMTQNVDVLPFTQWRTLAQDPKRAFEQTIAYSLKCMHLESGNFDWSTASLLKDKTLHARTKPEITTWLREQSKLMDDKNLFANWDWALSEATGSTLPDHFYLIPEQSEHISFYTVHRNSGSLLGIIRNAAGGAGEDMQSRYDELSRLMSFMQLTLGKLSLVSPAFQLWVELEKAKMKWLTTATITLMTMQAPSPGEIDEMFYSSACDFLFAAIGGYVEIIGTLGDISTVLDFMSLPHISGCGVER